jgi:hypothetical protein
MYQTGPLYCPSVSMDHASPQSEPPFQAVYPAFITGSSSLKTFEFPAVLELLPEIGLPAGFGNVDMLHSRTVNQFLVFGVIESTVERHFAGKLFENANLLFNGVAYKCLIARIPTVDMVTGDDSALAFAE